MDYKQFIGLWQPPPKDAREFFVLGRWCLVRAFFVTAGDLFPLVDERLFTLGAEFTGRFVPQGVSAVRVAVAGEENFTALTAFLHDIAFSATGTFQIDFDFNIFNIFTFGIGGTTKKWPVASHAAEHRRLAFFADFVSFFLREGFLA